MESHAREVLLIPPRGDRLCGESALSGEHDPTVDEVLAFGDATTTRHNPSNHATARSLRSRVRERDCATFGATDPARPSKA